MQPRWQHLVLGGPSCCKHRTTPGTCPAKTRGDCTLKGPPSVPWFREALRHFVGVHVQHLCIDKLHVGDISIPQCAHGGIVRHVLPAHHVIG